MTDELPRYGEFAAALAAWDAHCPGDARPAAALAAAARYARAPTPTHRNELLATLAGVEAAWLGVLKVDDAAWAAGEAACGARAAAQAALAVLCLGHSLLTTGAEAAAHWRNAWGHAQFAGATAPNGSTA